jgi:uncharacterized protein (TIGR02270 family)
MIALRRRQLELVLLQQTEDAGFLWLVRDHAVDGPNFLLADLVRLDERVEAYVDALRVAGNAGWEYASEALGHHAAGALFPGWLLAVESGDAERLDVVAALHADDADGTDRLRPAVAALVWASRGAAVQTVQRLNAMTNEHLRAVAVRVAGGRRADMGLSVPAALADPSPLVRARAFRTVGQLGRADLMAQLRPGLTDDDPECRFWSAWAAARMGAGDEALRVLADIAWNNLPRADRALDLLLRRLDAPQANAWLREFAKIPDRQRAVIRATGVIGDPLYIPWLIERMATLETARLAGEAFSMITGLDLAYRDLDRKPPQDFESGPNDDPADENVALDEDEYLPWPDPEKIGQWWATNRSRFDVGTPYFLGTPKPAADWLEALSDAFQRQRHAAALELAIRQPDKAMFEVRARGRLQRQLIARARGLE